MSDYLPYLELKKKSCKLWSLSFQRENTHICNLCLPSFIEILRQTEGGRNSVSQEETLFISLEFGKKVHGREPKCYPEFTQWTD